MQLIRTQDLARDDDHFKKDGEKTFCNFATAWIVNAVQGPLDPFLGPGGTPDEPGLLANQVSRNLANSPLYQEVTAEDAQQFANDGELVVAAWENPEGHGHLATVRPEGAEGDDPSPKGTGLLINQIGRSIEVWRETKAFNGHTPHYYVPRR